LVGSKQKEEQVDRKTKLKHWSSEYYS